MHFNIFCRLSAVRRVYTVMLLENKPGGGGGGATPYTGPYGEAPPERVTFFRLQVYERVGILLVEVYKRVGKSAIWVCERANTWILWLYKVKKTFFFVINSYLNDSAYTADKRVAKF